MIKRLRFEPKLISGVFLTLDVCKTKEDYTIWQVMPDNTLNQIFPNSIDLAKIIAEFKESFK